jgi:hypothetical protein
MGESGPIEPVVVEPVVNREKLLELLALQAEYPADLFEGLVAAISQLFLGLPERAKRRDYHRAGRR